jgi:hypothetical protein
MWMTVSYERMSRRTYDTAGAQLCGYWHHPAAGATGARKNVASLRFVRCW